LTVASRIVTAPEHVVRRVVAAAPGVPRDLGELRNGRVFVFEKLFRLYCAQVEQNADQAIEEWFAAMTGASWMTPLEAVREWGLGADGGRYRIVAVDEGYRIAHLDGKPSPPSPFETFEDAETAMAALFGS
jgi:hypothetical protein